MATSQSPPTLEGFNPFSADYLADPPPLYQRAHRDQPVFYYAPLDVWMITRYDDVHRVLTDSATFSSRAWRARPVPAELRERMPADHQRIPPEILPHLFINL